MRFEKAPGPCVLDQGGVPAFWLFFDFFAREWEGQNNGLRPLSCFTGLVVKLLAARGALAEP